MKKTVPLSDFSAQQSLSKVPMITLSFWIIKVLTTGMGEIFSDFLAHRYNPIYAVAITGLILLGALALQFYVRKYVPWMYWLVVVMVSIFGTMAADVLHVGLGIPYVVSTTFFAVVLAVIFAIWYACEKTLSIHSILTFRSEFFYWATVLATFALGTAAGDMTASTMHLGYFTSGVLFAILLAIPAVGYKLLGLNEILSFWFAYIMTRPVGASFSDWISVSHSRGGLGLGEGLVSLVLTIIIVILVGFQSMSGKAAPNEVGAN